MAARILCGLAMLAMLAGLSVSALFARQLSQMVIALPRISGTTVHMQDVEDANARGMLLTYEHRRFEHVSALGATHDVVLIGTNHAHPFVSGQLVAHGRFFSESDFIYSHRVAVLNTVAAFQLFGTAEAAENEITIGGQPYRVVGVVQGRGSGMSVYVPFNGNAVESVASVRVLPTHAWERMGITGARHRFVDFGALQAAVTHKAVIALYLLLFGVLAAGLGKCVPLAKEQVMQISCLAKRLYAREICTKPPPWKLAGLSLASLGMLALMGLTVADSIWRILETLYARSSLSGLQPGAFAEHLAEITWWSNASGLFFLGFAVFFMLMVISKP